MERKIIEVLRRMQDILQDDQLRELQSAMRIVFSGCKIVEETGLQVQYGCQSI